MGKEKKINEKEPYAKDEMLLALNADDVLSATEQQIKATMEKLKETLKEKKTERLNTQKTFVNAYFNTRSKCVELMTNVKDGSLSPKQAVSDLVEYVNSFELTLDTATE